MLGVAPFLGYLTSRTVGVPGDPGDVGNWADWIGVLALVLEAGLVTVSVGMLRVGVRRPAPVAISSTLADDLDEPLVADGWDLLPPG